MNSTLKVIFFSSFIGILLAFLFFTNIKEKAEAKNKPILYAFQVGVFKNKENADNYKLKFTTGKVLFDGDYYRVYVGVTTTNKDLLASFFEQMDYHYYIKELEIPDGLYTEIEKYDLLLEQSEIENYPVILNKMLESVENV